MSTSSHPHGQLSAYLDGALAPADRAAVEAHLDTCPACRAHLAQLRGVSALIASLPAPAPSRRLTPRLVATPPWLAPLRTLTTLASGISVFLFLASAILANIGPLASASAQASAAEARPAAPAAAGQASASARRNADSAVKQGASPSTGAFTAAGTAPSASAPAPLVGLGGAPAASAATQPASDTHIQLGPSPWLWLVLAIVMGAIALALQRRLRSS